MTKLVVPKPCRSFVLRVTDDSPMSGCTGMVRTLDGIIHRFLWPGVRQDVKRFVRTCESFQLVACLVTKERIPVLRLPVIEEPFWRNAADILGILVSSRNGHRFLLVISDYCIYVIPRQYP